MSKTQKHILVVRFSSLGDVAIVVPVLMAFQKTHPDVKLTVLTKPFFKPLFRTLKNVELLAPDFKHTHKGLLGLYRLSKEIKAKEVTAIADLHDVLRTHILKKFLFRLPFVQLDKGRKEKKALVAQQINRPLKTTIERYVDVFRKLGFSLELEPVEFVSTQALPKKLESVISDTTLPLIGIAPFAAYNSKVYPLKKMVEVIKLLSSRHTLLLFGGGSNEVETLNSIASQFDNTYCIAGQYDLNQELDIISNLKVMLAMDSGNGHMAAMLGVRVVTLWGVTHPHAGFGPFNQPSSNNLCADRQKFPKIPTSIYGNRFPKGYENVMESIEVKSVVNTVLANL